MRIVVTVSFYANSNIERDRMKSPPNFTLRRCRLKRLNVVFPVPSKRLPPAFFGARARRVRHGFGFEFQFQAYTPTTEHGRLDLLGQSCVSYRKSREHGLTSAASIAFSYLDVPTFASGVFAANYARNRRLVERLSIMFAISVCYTPNCSTLFSYADQSFCTRLRDRYYYYYYYYHLGPDRRVIEIKRMNDAFLLL